MIVLMTCKHQLLFLEKDWRWACNFFHFLFVMQYCALFYYAIFILLKILPTIGFLRLQCCDRKSQAACAQSFAPWQQATIEIMLAISLRVRLLRSIVHTSISAEFPRWNLSYYCLLALHMLWCYSSRTSRSW